MRRKSFFAVIFIGFVLMVGTSFVLDAEVIARGVIVTGINKTGDAIFDTFTVDNGDKITYAKYDPEKNDIEVEIAAGLTYNMFMITKQDGKTQAFIVWSPDDPKWQDILIKTNTVIAGIGDPGPNTLKRGDTGQLSVQTAQDGGYDFTLDFWRGNHAVATFSWVVK